MSKLPKGEHKVTLSEMKQTIDLEHYLKRKPTNSEIENFGEAAIEQINNRTLDGKKFNSRGSFAPYSDAYADKKGVDKNNVDLFLEGDMLDSLEYKKKNKSTVAIKLDGGDGNINVKKGYNHHTGDTLVARPWFGITEAETKRIVKEIKETPSRTRKESTPKPRSSGDFTLAELKKELEKLGLIQES